MLTTFPHKVYFDIDHKASPDSEFLSKITNKIDELFPDADLAISGSITEDKTSYHIVANNYFVESFEDRTTLKAIVKHLNSTFDESFDCRVYSNNQNMKCPNQSKTNDDRCQEVITQDNLKKHLITCFMRDDYYPMSEFEEVQHEEVKLEISIERAKRPLNIVCRERTIPARTHHVHRSIWPAAYLICNIVLTIHSILPIHGLTMNSEY